MEKRGLSMLIATVLLIGFTIVLASVVVTWGSSFVKKITADTSQTSNLQIECNKIDFKINDVKFGSYTTKDEKTYPKAIYGSVSNNLDTKIDDLIIQLVKKDGTAEFLKPAGGQLLSLDPYQTLNEGVPYTNVNINEDKIRIIPRLKIGNDIQSCPISYAKEKIIIDGS